MTRERPPGSVTTLRVILWVQVGYAVYALLLTPPLLDLVNDPSLSIPGVSGRSDLVPRPILTATIGAALAAVAVFAGRRSRAVPVAVVIVETAHAVHTVAGYLDTSALVHLALAATAVTCAFVRDSRLWWRGPRPSPASAEEHLRRAP